MTEVKNPEQKQAYLTAINALAQTQAPEWAGALRRSGAERFAELPFPDRRQEEWRFTNIAPILKMPFAPVAASAPSIGNGDIAPFLYHEAAWAELVFVDGRYNAALSRTVSLPKGMYAGSLAEAIRDEHPVAKEHLGHYAGNGVSTVFTALNTALFQDGAFVYAPKGVALEAPVHLVFVATSAAAGKTANPRNLIVLDESAELKLIESCVSAVNDAAYFANAVTETSIGENAALYRVKFVDEAPNAFHLATARVRQARNSRYTSYVFTAGGRIVRNEDKALLDGEGADCSLNGLYMTDGSMLADNATGIDHAKPHCTSWIGYKGILADASAGVFSGGIRVQRGAQKTSSQQLNRNLLLSDKATVDTKPLLEIFADDVKCTHGATIGQPPKELVYYFQTRGMSPETARGILTYGFADEIVAQLTMEPVRARLDRLVFDKYSPK